jgi:hypothetical protein
LQNEYLAAENTPAELSGPGSVNTWRQGMSYSPERRVPNGLQGQGKEYIQLGWL